jgi:hypothetical protein
VIQVNSKLSPTIAKVEDPNKLKVTATKIDFIYNCNPSNYTYKLRLPGKFVTKDRNGTYWRCQSPFGGGNSNAFQLNLICKFTSI